MAPTKAVATFDVALIGLGVRNVAHITLEALETLKKCKRGFVVSADQQAVDDFRTSVSSFLRDGESLPPLESLTRAYRKDRERIKNYSEAGSIVLDALEAERPIAYLTPGNPVTFDRVAQEILQGTRERGLSAFVVPGISSVDTILVDLQQELAPGMQIYEASWFVGMKVRPDPRLSCLLLQTTLFATNYPVIGRKPRTDALAPLKEYLLQFYPPEHLLVFVRSGGGWNDPASVYPVALKSLDDIPAGFQLGASMYIPPVEQARLDEQFLAEMSSVEQLKRRYPDS